MLNKEALDFRYLLLEFYKDLRISETDLVILLFIDHLILKETEFVTPDLINLQTNLDLNVIDEALVNLVNKGLIEYTTKQGRMVTSLNPLRNKLQSLFLLQYEQTKKQRSDKEFTSDLEEMYTTITNKFGRSLSPIELQTIQQWFMYGYTKAMINEALEESVKKKRFSLKAIDKNLLKLSTAVDYHLEGTSAQDETYRKNVTKTFIDGQKKINE